jgi:hypothetical protein
MQLRPRATARAQARQSGDFGGRESYEGHGWGAPQGPNPITQRFPLSQQWRMRDSNPRECGPNTLSKSASAVQLVSGAHREAAVTRMANDHEPC